MLLPNDVVPNPQSNVRLDIVELAEFDGVKGGKLVINIEHQSMRLDSNKIEMIWDYKDYYQCKYHFPVLSAVVSPFLAEQQENTYKATESDILQPKIITIDEKAIDKKLNNIRGILKDNKPMENKVVLDFALIAIFIETNKYTILKETCILFKSANQINKDIRKDIILVLVEMIKYHFKDDEKHAMELLNMLDKDPEVARRGARIWFEEEFEQQAIEHKKELNKKDEVINKKDELINQKDLEISELKLKLRKNGISY